jgi:catalytic LigB subunit of aromatic ring-opening dioxygenase
MAEILGIGVTHFPGLALTDAYMSSFLDRTLKSERVPAELKDPARWPEPMRRELGNDRGVAAAAEHRRRLVGGFRKVCEALDEFAPDFVLIWGDDQYENFREDGVPSFCVFALDEVECRPFARPGRGEHGNIWGLDRDTVVRVKGHPAAGSFLAAALIKEDFDVSYAYRMRHELGLPHAFINTVLFLDYDRRGFRYPVVPFHVNCYGSSVIAKRGSSAHLTGEADPNAVDPPSPNPSRCFDLGAAIARSLAASPWRVALIASSSWSHAFLTAKHHWIYPDVASDRARFDELASGNHARWRELTTAQIEDAGQQEFLNWVCLAGAMAALGRKAEIVDYVESYLFNSDKCFALFRAGA